MIDGATKDFPIINTFAVGFLFSPSNSNSMPYCTIVSNRSMVFRIAPSTRNDGATLFSCYPYKSPTTAPSRQSSSGSCYSKQALSHHYKRKEISVGLYFNSFTHDE
jgi:hypothetical protein